MPAYVPAYIKTQNRQVVYDLFREHGTLSRMDISEMTGMSFPTAVKVTDFLLSRGIVREAGLRETAATEGKTAGRKGRLLEFCPDAYRAIGFVYEGQRADIGLINLHGDLMERRVLDLPRRNGQRDLGPAARTIRELADLYADAPILGVGIGYPGIVDPVGKIVRHDLPDASRDGAFAERYADFVQAIGLPFYLENDVNLACVGEVACRNRREKVADLAYLSLGTGLGAGIVLDGQLRRGLHHRTGEIGVMQVGPFLHAFSPESWTDESVRLQDLFNVEAIRNRFGAVPGIDALLIGTTEDGGPESGGVDAEALRKRVAEALSLPLAAVVLALACTIDITEFVLAGLLPDALGEDLLERIRARLAPVVRTPVRISPPMDPHAGLTGAAMTVFDALMAEMLSES